LALSTVIQLMTSYYTATEYKPVREIAEASETGPAPTILSGFSTGLEASVYAILAVVGAIVGAALIGSGEGLDFQLYMISLAGMGVLTTRGGAAPACWAPSPRPPWPPACPSRTSTSRSSSPACWSAC